MRQTKIIATIGPATLDFPTFQNLIAAGVDYIRINTSYGNVEQYNQILENVKKLNNTDLKVIFDIKRPSTLEYCLKNNINHIALSFAETIEQITEVREKIPEAFIISKIESEKGVAYFDDILSASDGIMVARGDLSEAVFIEKSTTITKRVY